MRRRNTTLGDAFGDIFKQLKQQTATESGAAAEGNISVPEECGHHKARAPTQTNAAMARTSAKRRARIHRSIMRVLKPKPVDAEPLGVGLAVYHGAEDPSPCLPHPHTTLSELSADMARLQIRAPRAESKAAPQPGAVVAGESATAILGLDFGTAFTKAIVRFKQQHYVVDWSGVARLGDPSLLPSSFSEHESEGVALGIRSERGWSFHEGLKMRLLARNGSADVEAQCDIVLFIAAVFRYIAAWFPSVCKDARDLRWRLHAGLPADSWDDPHLASLFNVLSAAGMSLAFQSRALTRSAAHEALQMARVSPVSAVDVLPEFACQLYSYLESAQRQSDLHAMLDIGAGTLDVAFFNVHEYHGEDVLPIMSAVVKNLGTHYLIGALAGKGGEELVWRDRDAAASDEEVAKRVSERPDDVDIRRHAYLSAIARALNAALVAARKSCPSSRVWSGEAKLDLYLCGGGSRLSTIREHLERWTRDASKSFGLGVRILPLPRPRQLIGELGDEQYDRLSVAFGLSQLSENVGHVIRRHDLTPFKRLVRPEVEDRDATR